MGRLARANRFRARHTKDSTDGVMRCQLVLRLKNHGWRIDGSALLTRRVRQNAFFPLFSYVKKQEIREQAYAWVKDLRAVETVTRCTAGRLM